MQGSLVVEWCFEYNHIPEFEVKGRNESFLLIDVLIYDDDFGFKIELGILAMNIKKKVIGVIDSFFFFLTRYNYNEEKPHNMLSLMLNPRFNNLTLKYSFTHYELGVAIVEKYHRKSLFLIFLMSYVIRIHCLMLHQWICKGVWY